MSTTVKKDSSQQYVDFDEYIDFQLQKTRRSIKLTDMLTAGTGVIVLVLGYLLVFVVLDHWVVEGGFGTLARVFMLSAILFGAIGWVVWKVAMPYLKRINPLFAARTLELSDPQLKSSLLNFIDLAEGQREIPKHIREAMEKRAATTLAKVDVEEAVDRRPLLRLSYILLGIVIVGSIYTLFSPKKPWSSLHAALLPAGERSYATRTQIREVRPGDVEVLARTTLEVTTFLHGETPDEVILYYTTEDKKFVDEPIEMRLKSEETKEYRCILSGENGRGLLQNMTYRIVAGDAQSSSFHITVKHPPSATVQQVAYQYPKYMELEPRTVPTGRIDAWEGTIVTLKAVANKPVTRALLVPLDREEFTEKSQGVPLPMEIEGGTQLSLTWKLGFRIDRSSPHYYTIQCFNKAGETDPSPLIYRLIIRPDKKPEVDLVEPNADIKAPANAIIPLIVKARDPDFKLSYITLRAEKEGEELFGTPILFDGSIKQKRQSFQGTFDWKLEEHELKPGDLITFWIEARDNKLPLPNHSNSQKLRIRIVEPVSKKEAKKRLEEEKKQQQKRLEEREKEQNKENKKQDTGSEEKKDMEENPKEGDPKQKGKKQGDDQTKEGNSGDKQSDKGKKQNSSSAEEKPKEGEGKKGKTNQQQENKEQDDEKVLQKLMKKFKDQQDKEGKKGDSPEKKKGGQGEKSDKNKDGSSKKNPSQNQQDKSGKPNKPNESNTPKAPQENPDKKDQTPKEDKPDDKNSLKDNEKNKGDKNKGDKSKSDKNNVGNNDNKKDPNKKGGGKKENKKSNDTSKEKSDKNKNGGEKNGGEKKEPEGDDNKSSKGDDAKKGMGDEPEKGGGSSSKTDDPKKEGQQGETDGGKKSPGTEEEKKSDSSVENGKETPSKPDENATKKRANGNEKGDGIPDKDPNATKAKKPDQIKNNSGKKPKTTPTKENKDPKNTKMKKGTGEKPNGEASKKKQDPNKKTQKQKNDTPPKGQPNKGEKPPKSGSKKGDKNGGDAKNKQDNKQGNKAGKKAGSGKQESKKNDSKQGGKKGGGKTSKGGSKKSGGKKGAGKKGAGKKGAGKKGAGKAGKKGKGGGKGGKKSGTGESRGGASNKQGASSGGGETNATPDKANLEHAKKATDLVLKQLEEELQRGNVDKELLKELGWTEEKMKQFAKRMRKQLDKVGKAEDIESKARERQFIEMLKNLDMKKGSDHRKGKKSHTRNIEGFGSSGQLPVPAEYREGYNAYTRNLTKKGRGK